MSQPTADDQEMRDRIIIVERDLVNLEKNFVMFKMDTDVEFKNLNSKIDVLGEKVDRINQTLAKWLGGGLVGFAVLQFVLERIK